VITTFGGCPQILFLNLFVLRTVATLLLFSASVRADLILVKDGKAVRTQIQSGVSDGSYVEVAKLRTYPTTGEPGAWQDFNGSEEIIVGDLSEVSDGKQVVIDLKRDTSSH